MNGFSGTAACTRLKNHHSEATKIEKDGSFGSEPKDLIRLYRQLKDYWKVVHKSFTNIECQRILAFARNGAILRYATSMLSLCQEGKSSPDALRRVRVSESKIQNTGL